MDFQQQLVKILTKIDSEEVMEGFLSEILSTKELSDLTLRWQLLPELHQGEPQRTIDSRHHISLCKITRGSKILKKENSVSLSLLKEEAGRK